MVDFVLAGSILRILTAHRARVLIPEPVKRDKEMIIKIIIAFALIMAGTQVIAESMDPKANEYLAKGKTYADKGKLGEAEKAYSIAIKNDSTFAEAYSNLGTVYYKQNAYKLAEQMFEKALQLNPQMTEAKQNLGILYYASDMVEQAIKLWQEALDQDSSYSDRPRLHLFIGIAYLFSPEIAGVNSFISKATAEFDRALKINENFAEAHYWKAKGKELIPDLPGALVEYKYATELDPGYGNAYNQWGVLLFRNDNYAEAWDKFSKAVYCDPNNAIFHYNLGLTYLAREMRFEGNEEIQKAFKLNPHMEASGEPIIIHKRFP